LNHIKLTWKYARGARARWQPSMFSPGRSPSYDNHSLGTRYYVGGPSAFSCGLDHCKTPSWITTAIERAADYFKLVHSVDQNSRSLFRSVSPQFIALSFPPDVLRASYAAVSCFTLGYLSPTISVRRTDCYLNLIMLQRFFYRNHTQLDLRSISAFLKSQRSCRCLCWDHVSCLVFENIMPNSRQTTTMELLWLQLLSRST
jgi:hypothetical protein